MQVHMGGGEDVPAELDQILVLQTFEAPELLIDGGLAVAAAAVLPVLEVRQGHRSQDAEVALVLAHRAVHAAARDVRQLLRAPPEDEVQGARHLADRGAQLLQALGLRGCWQGAVVGAVGPAHGALGIGRRPAGLLGFQPLECAFHGAALRRRSARLVGCEQRPGAVVALAMGVSCAEDLVVRPPRPSKADDVRVRHRPGRRQCAGHREHEGLNNSIGWQGAKMQVRRTRVVT
mmetsp:Transcript_58469/g.163836  ORF Transcript_58469/g.163836 Transcript_58469/m.163836 type:complete len:233 (+) Transcript_58469:676-1374(+)